MIFKYMSSKLPKVIALCGYKRSGKDTIADYIQKYGYKKVSIAEPLKGICKTLFDLTEEQVDGKEKECVLQEYGVTPRALMQFFGTEIMQYKMQELCPFIGRRFWVDRLLKSLNEKQLYVISDLRFIHEYESIKKMFGESFIVICVCNKNIKELDEHVSEQEWKHIKYNHIMRNDLTLMHLYQQIDDFMKKYTN